MTRLALTSTDSVGGCLLRAGIADIVIPLGSRFVWGELPSEAKLVAMLGPGSLDHIPSHRLAPFSPKEVGPLDLRERCDGVELWFDPSPNAQLILIQLLDCLAAHETIVPKLSLFQADVDIGGQPPESISAWRPQRVRIDRGHLDAACMAWQAYRQSSPQHWARLLEEDISALPQLRQTVLELLEELPMPATGLGATEMRILELIGEGNATPSDVFPGHQKRNTRRVFGYWEVGELLDGLANAPAPVVAGLDEGPFTEEMHGDDARFARYKQSKLSLTPLGRAVLARREDFCRHNPVHRWWGGTELTNDNLWRWDSMKRALIAP